ncbi:MAG: hypothetical protein HY774_19380 [Acidobacteria bacterium]|nr:hypothetical protein [Acidobacteriota bacterium]
MKSSSPWCALPGDGRHGFHSLTLIPPEALKMSPASRVQIRTGSGWRAAGTTRGHKRPDKETEPFPLVLNDVLVGFGSRPGRDRGLRTTAITRRPCGPEILILALMGLDLAAIRVKTDFSATELFKS